MVSVSVSTKCFSLSLLALLANAHNTYVFTREYTGLSFFDNWDFYNNFDNLTNGDAIYVSKRIATQDNLAFINDFGNAIVKVDNKTKLNPGDKRNTIRIQTGDIYGVGSLWIADMLHVPYGCSVWPAWWSGAPGWPASGEIDTFESVNMIPRSQMALHTLPGCKLVEGKVNVTGLVNSTDCSYLNNSNQGCAVTMPNTNSNGPEFAAAGGGVFVTEFGVEGISIWFFSRPDVPAALSNVTGPVDTSKLGQPTASYPAEDCNPKFFQPQHLTLNIDICGDFAGAPAVFSETCAGVCSDYVSGPPSTYDNAYFEIKSIRAYHDPDVKQATIVAQVGSTSTVIPHDDLLPNGVSRDIALTMKGMGFIIMVMLFSGMAVLL